MIHSFAAGVWVLDRGATFTLCRGRRLERLDGLGQRDHSARLRRVEVLDEPPVEDGHALAGRGCRVMDVDDPARTGDLLGRGAEGGVRRGDLLRVDQRLSIEAHVPPLATRRDEAVLVVQVEVDTVERDEPMRPRREHHEPQARRERQPVASGPRSELLGQVRGAHHQRGDPRARRRDGGGREDTARRLDHAPERHGLGGAVSGEGVEGRDNRRGGFDLGQEHGGAPERAAAIRSSRPHGVSSPLTRITTSRRP
jgi:hypothetical protein